MSRANGKDALKSNLKRNKGNSEGVQIQCEGSRWVTLDELRPLQGELKTLSDEDFKKGVKSLSRYGFTFPFFVWINDGKTYVMDGHQRDRILKQLKSDGKKLPPKFPAVAINAKNEKEAREKILLLTSQYGHYTMDSVYEFIEQSQMNFSDLKDMWDFPKFDVEKFGFAFYDDKPPSDNGEGVSMESKYLVVVSCNDEQHQSSLLETFAKQGLQCRALIS